MSNFNPTVKQVEEWWKNSKQVLPAYDTAVSSLKFVVYDYPALIIAVDGLNGVGKTNLSRYIAWRFGLPLISIDEYRRTETEYFCREIKRLIVQQVDRRGFPIIVEGVMILELLEAVGREPNYRIFVKNSHPTDTKFNRNDDLGNRLRNYLSSRNAEETADLVVDTELEI